ncbi:DUF3164 family protein [Tenacibaculum maritimum]|nr:DUF3164 family protein [Tenacibaculum maritimum]MDB0610420.1 DUF3164 family protein [Tenacibaculum maritimum]
MNTETQTLDLSTLSEKDLQAEIQRRKSEALKTASKVRKELEADTDAFCEQTASKFLQLSSELKEVKDFTIVEANKLYKRMYAMNGKEPKEVKSFSRKSSDGKIMVTVDYQERFEFTDEATVHINAIKDIFKKKFSDRNKGLYNILDGLLIKGTKGDYDPKLLAKARKQVRELGDENLIAEFDKLDDCQRVYGTSKYCRVKVKDDNGKWKDVNVQFSSL